MFQIIVDDKTFYTSSAPHYVKKKISSGAWIPAMKDDAEGVALMGEVYALTDIIVKEVDGGEVVLSVSERTVEGLRKIIDLQEALCDLSETLEALKDG